MTAFFSKWHTPFLTWQGVKNLRSGPIRTGSGLMQAEKPGDVGRADGDAEDSTGDHIGDRLPEAGGAQAESAFHHEARVVGRPLEKDLCGRGLGDGQAGRREAD